MLPNVPINANAINYLNKFKICETNQKSEDIKFVVFEAIIRIISIIFQGRLDALEESYFHKRPFV